MKYPLPGTHTPERRSARNELIAMMHDSSNNGIVISGPVGSHKTELLASAIGPDFLSAVRLLCSPVSVQIPFGALAPLLIDMDAPPEELSVFRFLSNHLEGVVSEEPLLVVVEEAQFLDAASAFVLSQLALARRIKLVLLAVGDGHTEPVVASSELGARLGRISLNVLSSSEISEYARGILGAPVTQSTEHAIAAVCAGNPVLIEAFINSALSQKVLRKSKGWFGMVQTHVETDEILSAVVSVLQKRLSEADAEALEILALGGAEDSAFLAEVCGTASARLVGTGLATYDGHSRLRISAPLYARVLRDLVRPGRSNQLWSKVSTYSQDHGTLPSNLLWAVENGSTRSPDEYLHAVEAANTNVDFVAALRLCRMSEELVSSPNLVLQAATALLNLGQYQLALHEIAKGLELTDDPRLVLGFRSLAVTAIWQQGDSEEDIESLILDWTEQCRDWQREPIVRAAADIEHNLRAVASLRMWLDLATGKDPAQILAKERVFEAVEGADAGSLESVMARNVKCVALLRLGFFVEAADEAVGNLDTVTADSGLESLIGYQVMATALRALFAAGEYANVRLLVSQRMPKNPHSYLPWAGTMHLWAAFAAMQEGRWPIASELLYEACAELSLYDPDRLLGLSEALCAFEKFQLGHESFAVSAEGHDVSCLQRGTGNENLDANLIARAYHILAGSLNVEEELLVLADGAHAARSLHTELQLLMLLWKQKIGVRTGHGAIGRLRALCMPSVGRSEALFLHAATLGDTDEPWQLVEAANELFASGETGLGAEVMAMALISMGKDGDERQRGVVLRHLASWVQGLGGLPWGSVNDVLNERILTAREKEIITLVSQGMSNKEIATFLTVSQRTVEGHLYRVFAKLGIAGRNELDRLT